MLINEIPERPNDYQQPRLVQDSFSAYHSPSHRLGLLVIIVSFCPDTEELLSMATPQLCYLLWHYCTLLATWLATLLYTQSCKVARVAQAAVLGAPVVPYRRSSPLSDRRIIVHRAH